MRNSLRALALLSLSCVVLTCTASQVSAQGFSYNGVAHTADNTPLNNGMVAVCSPQPTNPGNVGEPCTPLATLYADSTVTTYTITSAVRSAGVVTIATSTTDNILPKQWVAINGASDQSFDGTFQVTLQLGNGKFQYAQSGPNGSSNGGTVTGANPINADTNGNFSFWAAPGTYFLEFYSPSRATAPFTEIVTLGCVPDSTASGCGSGNTVAVAAFGAKCNDTTDDTAAIQGAVDSLPTTGATVGGTVSFSGVCMTTAAINVNTPNITFVGTGHFQFITQNAPPSYIDFQGTTAQNAINVNAQGFAMDNLGVKYPTTIGGPLAAPVAPALTAVSASGCPAEAYYVEATYVSAQGETNVSAESTITTTTGQCFTVTSPSAESGATGWRIYASSNSNNETLQVATLPVGTNWIFGGTLVNLGFRPSLNTTAYAAINDPNGAQLDGVKLFTDLSASVGSASQANGYNSFGCCGKLHNVYIAGFGIGVFGSGSNNDFSIKDSYIQADNVGMLVVNGADINIEDDDFEGNGVGNLKMLYGSPYKISGNYFEQQGSNPPSYNVQVGDTTIPPLSFTPIPGAITIDNNFMQCNLTQYPPSPIVVETSQVLDIERNSFSQCEHENIVDNTVPGSEAHIKMLGNISDAQPLAWITHTTGLVESDVDAIGTAENPGTPYFYGLGIDSQSGASALNFNEAGSAAWQQNATRTTFSLANNGTTAWTAAPFGSGTHPDFSANYAATAAEVIVTQSGGSATFDASLGNTFELIMSANVTSSTLVNAQPGQWLDFIICQGGGGPWTFAWPSNVFGGGTVGTTNGPCSTQQFYVSGSSPANAWAAGPMTINVTSGSAGLSLPAVAGTVPYFTGSWTNGNCLEAGGSVGLIDVASGPCGTSGSGSNVEINGSAALGTANFNNSMPSAGSNFLNLTWQQSGSSVSAELPVFGASGSSHAMGLVPDPGSTAGSTRFLREDGTWNVPSGGGGGSSVSVNGTGVSTPNFNSSTPAAASGFTNVTFQQSGSSVSAEVPNAPGASPPAVIGFTPAMSGSPQKTLTVGAECSNSTPCNVRVDNTVYNVTSTATAVIGSSVSGNGTVIIYLNSSGNMEEVDNLGTGNVTCTDCTSTQETTPAFPYGSFPIVSIEVLSGAYATLSDERSGASIASYQAGNGINSSQSSGVTTFSIDPGFTLLTGQLTTTAATSDSLTITGLTSSSICTFSAANSSAATNIASSYISAVGTNSVTLTHAATAGMIYNFTCQEN